MLDLRRIEKATGATAIYVGHIVDFELDGEKTPISYEIDMEVRMSIIHGRDMSEHFYETLISNINLWKQMHKSMQEWTHGN